MYFLAFYFYFYFFQVSAGMNIILSKSAGFEVIRLITNFKQMLCFFLFKKKKLKLTNIMFFFIFIFLNNNNSLIDVL